MTITTYTDLGLRLQTEVAELKVSLEKEQALTALEYHRSQTRPIYQTDLVMTALREELFKPEPEPVGEVQEYDDYGYPWRRVSVYERAIAEIPVGAKVYAAPTEPNCKFPTCHSQEYQNKLVQEILGQEPEPYAWVFVPHNELLWPDEVEHKTPCKATGYIPLYTKGTP